jgi:replicative DNA helicase
MKEQNNEEIILGCIIHNPQNSYKAFELLKREHFLNRINGDLFFMLCNMNNKNIPIEMLTVMAEIKAIGLVEQLGGFYGISKLTDYAATNSGVTSIESCCYLIIEAYLRSRIELIGLSLTNDCKNPLNDVFELLSKTEKILGELQNGVIKKKSESIGILKQEVLSDIEKVLHTGIASGVPTSIHRLNLQTNGWQKSDLIILAGRPAMGKTSVAIDFCLTPALNGTPTAFFSLEMSSHQLASRILSVISQMNVQDIVNKRLTFDMLKELNNISQPLNNTPLYIDDSPSITLFELKTKARRLVKEKQVELIVIDYLQLMRGEGNKQREQEISEISRGLKALAKELNVPIIALSQLSRKCEERADKKPMLSDLRESGAIEQDADMVMFCHRPEYYGLTEYELGGDIINNVQGLFIFIIAKFRNGQTGEIKARWIGSNTAITNYTDNSF